MPSLSSLGRRGGPRSRLAGPVPTDPARKARADAIGRVLDRLFPDLEGFLDHRDPFTLLVAVVLSAQTTDKKVNEVTPALFARAPTPAAMAALPEATLARLIRTVGLAPTKARNLRRMAALLVERHDGRVPADMEALEALPGVGHKTASVVLAQAFGEPTFPVDTHIHRLARRWGLSDGTDVRRTEEDLKRVFPRSTWIRRHLQLIAFGRLHCPALRHEPAACPICSFAAEEGGAPRVGDGPRREARSARIRR